MSTILSRRLSVELLFSTIALLLMVCVFTSCGVYSFTGASVSPDLKTISVSYFPNRAPLVQPLLSQQFTESLKDKFLSETNLTLVRSEGDIAFEGEIMNYVITPMSIESNQTAALNRLTITVNVRYFNTKDQEKDFETSFTRFTDYDSKQNLSAVEEELIEEVSRQLIDDIFNKAFINW